MESNYVNGYILDAALGPSIINSKQLQKVNLLASKYPDKLRIVCSTPSTAVIEVGITIIPDQKINPCDKIFTSLKNRFYLQKSGEIVEEQIGPHLTVIKLFGFKG